MKVSVVTVMKNPGDILIRTIKSVAEQTADIEWIVIDGESTDGSLEKIQNASRTPRKLISEPDQGIADAMNKGIAASKGEAIIFMNAGDTFFDSDSLEKLVTAWNRSDARWIMGAAEVLREDGTVLFVRGYEKCPSNPWDLVRTNCRIMHQAVLAEASLFREFGGFDLRWRIGIDYDLWIRWLQNKCNPQMCLIPICKFYRGGASGSPLKNYHEEQLIRRHHGVENAFHIECMLRLLARLKSLVRGRYGLWLYRFKERLGIRI
jgi:glycosyltransferase